jgi:hypothetical protein
VKGRNTKERREPISIMPAPGWYAVYRGKRGKLYERPLVGWAVMKVRTVDANNDKVIREEENEVHGLIFNGDDVDVPNPDSGFVGYRGPGEKAEDVVFD